MYRHVSMRLKILKMSVRTNVVKPTPLPVVLHLVDEELADPVRGTVGVGESVGRDDGVVAERAARAGQPPVVDLLPFGGEGPVAGEPLRHGWLPTRDPWRHQTPTQKPSGRW